MTILGKIWKYAKWPVIVLALLYVALVIYEIPAVRQKDKSDAAVARIHAQKLTMADVDGKHLPPPPDPDLVDATVQGVDANGNGIRDDVELAIFKKYPENLKLRAAALQYAVAEQNFLNFVFDKESWHAAAENDARAVECIKTILDKPSDRTALANFIDSTVIDSNLRESAENETAAFTTSYGYAGGSACDISL